jgi:DNA (cytosine-5)-methyltransferase 1
MIDHEPNKRASTVIDLFAGVGGLSEGFRKAGCRILGGVEWDRDLAESYRKNHQRHDASTRVFCTDVRQLDPSRLMSESSIEPEELTYLIGGAPCQGYSTIGKRRSDDYRNQLLFQFPRFLSVLRSQAFLIENVPGLLSFGRGSQIERLLDQLVGIGYQNATYELVDAARCWVPQRRKRVLIYGTLTGKLPDIASFGNADADVITVRDALLDLPDPVEAFKNYSPGSLIPYGPTPPSAYGKGLRGTRRKVSRWEPVLHSVPIIEAYRNVAPGKTDPATRCRRLEEGAPANALRAGSKTRTACRPIHPTENRVVTVREAARLHSFADDFVFPLRKSMAHVAIGNAVPPSMAETVARAFLSVLNQPGIEAAFSTQRQRVAANALH